MEETGVLFAPMLNIPLVLLTTGIDSSGPIGKSKSFNLPIIRLIQVLIYLMFNVGKHWKERQREKTKPTLTFRFKCLWEGRANSTVS